MNFVKMAIVKAQSNLVRWDFILTNSSAILRWPSYQRIFILIIQLFRPIFDTLAHSPPFCIAPSRTAPVDLARTVINYAFYKKFLLKTEDLCLR